VRLRIKIKTEELALYEREVYAVNMKIIAILEICKVSVIVSSVSEGQITLTDCYSWSAMTERNVSLLFNDELDSSH
jgi:hypothetical protein